jgi:hypothetical protein
MTRDQLRSLNCKQLADIARRRGISGWHDLRKEQLVEALTKSFRNEARRGKTAAKSPAPAPISAGIPPGSRTLAPEIAPLKTEARRDRLVLLVRGPYWLSCHWELNPKTVDRARAALGPKWHSARAILRLFEVSHNDAGYGAEKAIRDIAIHDGVDTWFIDVDKPPHSYRIDIGYLSSSGHFYSMLRSEVVTTPAVGACDAVRDSFDPAVADRLAALSGSMPADRGSREVRQFLEERMRRPLGSPSILRLSCEDSFEFAVQADLLVYGRTHPGARVTVENHPAEVLPDGSFALRLKLPETRQIIRCVATSPEGGEERTVIVHIERNIRHLEPASLQETD